jgi:hypothetical protein
VLAQAFAQDGDVHVAVEVLRDDDDVGDALAPHHLVGVVLVRTNEDDRTLAGRHETACVPTILEVGGNSQTEDPDELVDGSGTAGPGEDDDRLVVSSDRVADGAARVLAQPRRLQTGAGALGVRVGVPGEDLVADEVLDEAQPAAGCRVVGVGDASRAVGPVHHLVVADDARADRGQQLVAGVRRHRSSIADSDAKSEEHNAALPDGVGGGCPLMTSGLRIGSSP